VEGRDWAVVIDQRFQVFNRLFVVVVSLNSRDGIGQQLKAVAFSVEPEMHNGGAKSGLGDVVLPQSWLSILWNTLQ
jgi:hypothetical protein